MGLNEIKIEILIMAIMFIFTICYFIAISLNFAKRFEEEIEELNNREETENEKNSQSY